MSEDGRLSGKPVGPRNGLPRRGQPTVRRLILLALVAAVVLFEVGLLLLVSTPQGRASIKAALFVPEIIPGMPLKPLSLLTDRPTKETVDIPLTRAGSADLYLPAGSGRHSAVLFYLGVVPPDRDESRIVALGEALARSGVVVMVPWLETQARGRIVPEDIDSLVSAFELLRSLDRVDPDRVGMGGVCTGASMTLVAAQDDRIRTNVKFVNSFAGYYDAEDFLKAVGSRSRFYGEGAAPWRPDDLTMRLMTDHLIEGVSNPDDRAALTSLFTDTASGEGGGPGRLGPEGLAVYRLIQGVPLEEVDGLIDMLSPKTRRLLALISPSTNIDRLDARALIMHDRADRLVPSEESRRLADAIGEDGDTYHTEFSLFQNVVQVHSGDDGEPGPLSYVVEAFKLIQHMYVVMREIS